MSYPETKVKEVDVTAVNGAVKIGCKTVGGEIIPAGFVSEVTENSPANVTWADYSSANGRFFALSNEHVYISLTGKKFVETVRFTSNPVMVDDVDNLQPKAFLICGGFCTVYDGSSFSSIPLDRNIYAAVMKCGRLFGADTEDKTLLHWSGGGGVFDWKEGINGAGWLKFDAFGGNILNLAVLGDDIVAVREYGLTLIKAFGSPENFKQISVRQKTPLIYKDTAKVIGAKLYFYTQNGLYSFNGNKIEEVLTGQAKMLENAAYAAVYGQNYCVCGTSAALKRKVILIYETSGGANYFIDIPAQALCASTELLAFTNEKACLLKRGGPFTFESGEITFGTTANKTLTRVEVFGGKADLEVSNGVISRIVGGVSGSVRINLRGKKFKITVKSAENLQGVKAFAEVGYGI